MSVTLANIQSELLLLHHRTDITGGATELLFINSAQKILQRLGFFKGEDTSTTLNSPAISSGSGIFSLSFSDNSLTDFRTYLDIVQLTPSYKSGFSTITIERANTMYRSRSTLADTVFESVIPYSTKIDFYPPYTTTSSYSASYWTFTLFYKKWLADLDATTNTSNYLTNNASDIIIMLTYAMICLVTGENSKASSLLSYANILANQFINSEYGDTGSGKEITLRDLEAFTASLSRAQLGGSSG